MTATPQPLTHAFNDNEGILGYHAIGSTQMAISKVVSYAMDCVIFH